MAPSNSHLTLPTFKKQVLMFYHLKTRCCVIQTTVNLYTANVFFISIDAKQKHLGCKKVRGQSEATLQTGRCAQKF